MKNIWNVSEQEPLKMPATRTSISRQISNPILDQNVHCWLNKSRGFSAPGDSISYEKYKPQTGPANVHPSNMTLSVNKAISM